MQGKRIKWKKFPQSPRIDSCSSTPWGSFALNLAHLFNAPERYARLSVSVAGICVSIFLVSMLISGIANAQASLISFAEHAMPAIAAPKEAQAEQAVIVNSDELAGLQPGASLAIQIAPDDWVALTLYEIKSYVNGDITLGARGQGAHSAFSLTMTIGADSLFGYISENENLWQLYAVRDQQDYLGWVYRPGQLNSGAVSNDYVLPQRFTPLSNAELQARQLPFRPLRLGEPVASGTAIAAASTAGISSENFRIEQQLSSDAALVDESTEIIIILSNTSGDSHSALLLEIFFLLEDSTLLSAPESCSEQLSLSLQKVLHCEVGDFAAGEQKSIKLSVQPHGEVGSQLFSTAVVGELRHDQVINIVEDVRTDSDEDGISDFNEALLGTDPLDVNSVDFAVSTVDVMALYTAGAATLYPQGVETRINQLVAVANQIYRDSGVAITLRPVHHQQVAYNDSDDMDTALDHLINRSHPAFKDVSALRASYGADLVMLFRPLEVTGDRCGLAPIGGFETAGYFDREEELQYAFSHIAIDCPVDIVVAHELGHNMGLTHSHVEDGFGGTFRFSTGYGVEGQFATVMARPEAFGTENRVPYFSNPRADCLGFVCGVDSREENGADAVQSLNLVRHQIANYLPTVVPDPPAIEAASSSGDTNAVITVYASGDGGRSFSSRFSPTDRVDLSTAIRVDDRHIGQTGSLHVLVGERGGDSLYQLNLSGELELWDGMPESLISVGDARELKVEEHLVLLDGFQFDESMVGMELAIYIGYRVLVSEDFVYTNAPHAISIVRAD